MPWGGVVHVGWIDWELRKKGPREMDEDVEGEGRRERAKGGQEKGGVI
jgi:hypothetical protein